METDAMVRAIAILVEKDCAEQLQEITRIENLPAGKKDEKAMYKPLVRDGLI